jgi:hypothetical protein
MASNPKGLNIPLVPKNWFWPKVVLVVVVVIGLVAWLEPAFGLAYLVTAIFLLPVLMVFLISSRVRNWEAALGGLGQVGVFALLFIYMALVKTFLTPIVLAAF